jgi:hypothetical protein
MMSNGSISVYDFAHSGATCSGKLTPRIFKPVLEAQIPEYTANVTVKSTGKPQQDITYIMGKNGTYVPLPSKDTMYSIWIGTNDVGVGCLLTDPLPGVSIVNTTECVFDWVQALYDQGARNFLIQNVREIPLVLHRKLFTNRYPDDAHVAASNVLSQRVRHKVLEPAPQPDRVEHIHRRARSRRERAPGPSHQVYRPRSIPRRTIR